MTAHIAFVDPIVNAVAAYRAGLADFNANAPEDDNGANAYAEVSWKPPMDALVRWQHPADTRAGAIVALKFALSEMEEFEDPRTAPPMIRAALAYLDQEGRQ